MFENITLPPNLSASLGSETQDFAVKSTRLQPVKKSLYSILIGLALLAIMGIFVSAFLGPIFQGQEVHFTANGSPVTAGPGNLGPIVLPSIILGIFTLVGLGILIYGIYSLIKKGGYFVGTPTRLVNYINENVKSTDWEQFTGNIEVSGNDASGTLTLQLRTGKTVSNKRGPDKFVPDVIYICGIANIFEIEKLCRKRIKENDPTPAGVVPGIV